MPYFIQADSSWGLITVSYKEKVDLAQRISATKDVCRLIENWNSVRILVDVRAIQMEMTLEEQEQFGRYIATRDELEKAKVAVLHKSDYNPNVIIDTFAYLNGYNVVAFTDDSEAQDWLRDEIR